MNRLFNNLCNCLRCCNCNKPTSNIGCGCLGNDCCCNNCCTNGCCDCCNCNNDECNNKPTCKSSYIEALGNAQEVLLGGSFVFSAVDKVGTDIDFVNGTEFVLKTKGLYHIEWSANIVSGNGNLVGIAENDEPTSALTGAALGVTSSGALVNVTDEPVVITLKSFGGTVSAVCPAEWVNTAVSIRILKFADGYKK